MAEDAPAGRRRRRFGILVALAILLPLALWQGAPHLVRKGLLLLAETSDLDPRSLEVHRVGWRRAEIGNVVLGEDREIEIRRIVARYSPLDVFRLRFERILVEGLRLRARLDRGGLAPGVLASLVESEGGASLRCDDVRLIDGRLEIASPLGTARARVEGEADLGGPAGVSLRGAVSAGGDRIRARIAFEPAAVPGSPTADGGPLPPGRGTLELEAQDASIDGVATGVRAGARFVLVAGPEEARILLPERASLGAEALAAGFARRLGAPPALEQALTAPLAISLESAGESAPLLRVRRKAGGWQIAWAVSLAVRAGKGARLEADSGGTATLGGEKGGETRLALSPLALEVHDLALPAGRIAAAAFRIEGEGPTDAFAGRLEAEARGEAEAGEAAGRIGFDAALRARVASAEGEVRVTPEECLSLRLEGFELGDLGTAEPLALCLASSADEPLFALARHDGAAIALAVHGDLRPAPFQIRTEGRAAVLGPLDGETPALGISFERDAKGRQRFTLRGEGGVLRAPAAGLEAEGAGFALAGRLDGERRMEGTWRVGRMAGTGKRPLLAPLSLSGTIGLADRVLSLTGGLENRGRTLSLKADGKHDFDTGRGSVRLLLAPVRFEPGVLGPGDLLPALGRRIDSARGSVEASGSFRWGPEFLETPLRLRVKGLTFETAGVDVEELGADLRFERSLPPRSAPGQVVRFARAESGVAITEGRAVFGITEEGRIEIATFEGRSLGGKVTGGGWMDWQGREGSFRLGVAGLRLSDLLAAADLEGLTGSGAMDGVIPIEIVDRRVLVRGARFQGSGEPGWIRYRPGQRPGFFPPDDERFDLVLAILDDFRYDSLGLGLDGPLFEQVDLTIDLSGSNPEVEGGHPVELHLRVEGFLLDLLQGASASTRIGETLGRRMRESGPGRGE